MAWNTVHDVAPTVGAAVFVDTWGPWPHVLQPCDDWALAAFRLRVPGSGIDHAVNVKVTGRTWQTPHGVGGVRCVRVRVEFVGDGEPSQFAPGWLRLD